MRKCQHMSKGIFTLIFALLLIQTACLQRSEKASDKSAGLNGGFEISKNNLPVNWIFYAPNTLPDAEFNIVLDTTSYKEGKKSLRFDVSKCSSTGGWNSPGFTNEFSEVGRFMGPDTYKISMWIKNSNSTFRVKAGAIDASEGTMEILIESNEEIKDWKYLEYLIEVPERKHLRLELNILKPGSFWVDDIQILSN